MQYFYSAKIISIFLKLIKNTKYKNKIQKIQKIQKKIKLNYFLIKIKTIYKTK